MSSSSCWRPLDRVARRQDLLGGAQVSPRGVPAQQPELLNPRTDSRADDAEPYKESVPWVGLPRSHWLQPPEGAPTASALPEPTSGVAIHSAIVRTKSDLHAGSICAVDPWEH